MNFIELCLKRFSARNYTDEPVSDADLHYILESFQVAPSAVNRQPWKFLIVQSEEAKAKVQRAYDREWIKTAPLYIIAFKNTNEQWVRKYDGKPHGDIDVAIAVEHICLAATDCGLGSCWVCNFNPDIIKAEFPQPVEFEPIAIIPIGHIPEDGNVAVKTRKSLDRIVQMV